jgi:hypothetical protein
MIELLNIMGTEASYKGSKDFSGIEAFISHSVDDTLQEHLFSISKKNY